jgi:hypothetical protein
MTKSNTRYAIGIALGLIGFCLLPLVVFGGNVDSTFKYAWGENIGWLNFGTPQGDVTVGVTEATGYAWGENIGWLSLSCENTSSCATVDYRVTRDHEDLAGYAWGENIGWVSFSCENTSSCATVDYGVTIDTSGHMAGYAWGENVGWIVFNCSTTSSCGTVNYYVKVSPTPGGPPPPTPTPTPSSSVSPSPTASASPGPGGGSQPPPGATPPPSTPTSTPPPATPTAPPPTFSPTPPPGPITRIIDLIGRGLDRLGQQVFGGNAPPPVTIGAVVAALLALIPILLAIATILAQHEVAAATFSFLQVIGLKRKAKEWGTVYDTRTKHPVPFAKLQLIDLSGRVLETRFADRDGRYGFLVSPKSLHGGSLNVRIVASKDGYQFPSRITALDNDFIVYDHLYRGEQFEVGAKSVLNFNIPMDPVAEHKRIWSAWGMGLLGGLTDRLLNLAFIAGLFLVPLNYIWYPTVTNLVIAIVFFVANGLRIFVLHRPYGIIRDAATGRPMAFALVTLNDLSGKRLAFAVSDERGRYFLPAERGAEYILTVHTPANVVPSRSTDEHISPRSYTSRRAWVTLNMSV